MSNNVTYSYEDGVATISMDDGKANALSHDMWDELSEAFDKAEASKAIVVLTGRDGLFSGGFDLKEIAKGPEQAILLTSRGSKMARRMMSFPTPVIGVSTGHCIAIGGRMVCLRCRDHSQKNVWATRNGAKQTHFKM